jgi:acyl-CoA thioesterase I
MPCRSRSSPDPRRAGRALAAALLLAAAAGPAAAGEACEAPVSLTRLAAPLPRTAERLRRHELLTVVAVGSSSTAGVGASAPERSYPSRLAAELERRLGRGMAAVRNKGVGGETAIEMVARFDRDVLAETPDLVIWQVGSNAVLRDSDVDRYDEVVRGGVGRLKAAGIDVMLMDMQYAPRILAHPQHEAMEERLHRIGRDLAAPLFERFAIMKHWGGIEKRGFPAFLSPDGLHMNDFSYGCVARLIADAVLVRAAPPPVASRR